MKENNPIKEKKICTAYDQITAELYLDHELPPKTAKAFKEHIKNCHSCKEKIETLEKVSQLFTRSIHHPTPPPSSLEEEVLLKIKSYQVKSRQFKSQQVKSQQIKFRLGELLTSWKFYMQTASLVALSMITLFFFQGTQTIAQEPSAIVESMDSTISSVMIFETQHDKHTIIWYKET